MKGLVHQRKIRRMAGTAMHRYGMIAEGDRVLVAVSGGKDSLTLLWYLNDNALRSPVRYELFPVYLEMGFSEDGAERMERHFNTLRWPNRVEVTRFGPEAHEQSSGPNPCFLCAWRRRQRLFELAEEFHCTKVAFGHSRDDVVETLLLNMFYAGQISTMKPYQPLFEGRLTLIRPLVLLDSDTIRRFAVNMGLPVFQNPCPSAVDSRRSEVRKALDDLSATNGKIRSNIFNALQNVREEYLL